jgi:hypothetical protein
VQIRNRELRGTVAAISSAARRESDGFGLLHAMYMMIDDDQYEDVKRVCFV